MNTNARRMSRRQMLRTLGGTATLFVLAACGANATGDTASAPTSAASMAATGAPAAGGATAAATKPSPVPVPTGVSGLSEGSAQAGSFANAPNLAGKLSLPKLNIAFIPADDAAKTLSDNKDLLAYMKQVFGIDVTGAVGTSYTAVIEAMRAKKVDIAFYGPFSYILGHEEANAQALIQGETAKGELSTYTSLIITQANNPIASLADIKGKHFSFVDPASTSGHLVPSYTMLQKASLSEKDYTPIYAGSHPASYLAVANNKVDAGAIASDIFQQGIAAGSIDQAKVKIVDTSFDIPGSPAAVRGDISQADQDLLLQAFMAINDQPHDGKLFKATIAGLGVGTVKLRKADDKAYDLLRQIPQAIGIDIHKLK